MFHTMFCLVAPSSPSFSHVCVRPALTSEIRPFERVTSDLFVFLSFRTFCGRPSGKYKKALHAFNHLKEAIANAPDIDQVLKEAEKSNLTEEEAVLEILWMLK